MNPAELWPDLPGSWSVIIADQNVELFYRDLEAILVELDVSPFGRWAGWIGVPSRWLDDVGVDGLDRLLFGRLDPIFRPWRYPDRPAIAELVLFPRVARLEDLVRRRLAPIKHRRAMRRIRAA